MPTVSAATAATSDQSSFEATRSSGLRITWRQPVLRIAATLCVITIALGPRPSTGTDPAKEPGSVQPETTDSSQVVLHLREAVELHSAIVRLADVATPVGRAPTEWPRAASATIGLLPTDGRRLRIERQRLSELLQRSNLIGETIRWSGPDTVSVRYLPGDASPAAKNHKAPIGASTMSRPAEPSGEPSRQSPADHTVGVALPARQNVQQATAISRQRKTHPVLDPAERNRIERMIESVFERTHEEIHSRYELVINTNRGELNALGGLRAIRSLRITGTPGETPLQMVVSGDAERERLEVSLPIELRELPLAVVATAALNRGDLVTARDVQLKPVPRGRNENGLINDVKSVVGMEMKRPASAGRLISWDDITPPIVIRRSEMVELRVVGGGVTVTTVARALGPASVGEPVTVETNSPRRRLVGNAVAAGIVEIITRPPTTSNPRQ